MAISSGFIVNFENKMTINTIKEIIIIVPDKTKI